MLKGVIWVVVMFVGLILRCDKAQARQTEAGVSSARMVLSIDPAVTDWTVAWLSESEVQLSYLLPNGHSASTVWNIGLKSHTEDRELTLSDANRAVAAALASLQCRYSAFAMIPTLQSLFNTLPATTYGNMRDWLMSPQGDRIAWLVCAPREPWHVSVLQREFPDAAAVFGMPVKRSLEIWLSTGAGVDFQRLCRISDDPEAFKKTAVEWLPDGKHISYTASGGLWVMPVSKRSP
jgi:hypothetical protein